MPADVRKTSPAVTSAVPAGWPGTGTGAAGEVDAEVEASEDQRREHDEHEQAERRCTRACGVPTMSNAPLAGVEPGERADVSSWPSPLRCRRGGRGGPARSGADRAPRRRRPGQRRTAEEPGAATASATSGWVNRNTTTRSSTVDRPSVNAKPFTCPTARMYSTAAARKRHRVGGQDRAPGPDPAASRPRPRSVRPRASRP